MSTDLIYLASPYSAPTAEERQQRFELVCKKAAELMDQGHKIFCPIAHSHPIEVHGMDHIHSGEFWLEQDFAILEHCSMMWVYCLPGWKQSKGIKQEMDFAKRRGIPVRFIYTETNCGKVAA